MKTIYDIRNEFKLENLTDNENDYISNRVIAQISWYDSKATTAQKKYKLLSTVSFSLTALIPILVLFDLPIINKIIVAILSSVASVINFVTSICMYKDLWIKYRTNCENLKSKLHIYLHQNDNSDSDLNKFIRECEECFTEEFSSWSSDYRSI